MTSMDDEQVQVLNFSAKLVTKNKDDQIRKFVVSFYLFDQTIGIFEELVPNSGFRHGKFLQKTRVKNPATKQFFAPSDFYVGAKITVAARTFELTAAAELALNLMESNPDDFPEADLTHVLPKLGEVAKTAGKDLRAMFEAKAKGGKLTTADAMSVLEQFVPKMMTKHAAITITRGFDRDGSFAYEEVLKFLKL